MYPSQTFFKVNFLFSYSTDHPVEPGRTPTEAHTGLKNLIDALVEEIREDTAFQVNTLLYQSFRTKAGSKKKGQKKF